tara:strand:- start:450 stop:764 length:315 start_codon:yes stop_codon:yes gene_type:complete
MDIYEWLPRSVKINRILLSIQNVALTDNLVDKDKLLGECGKLWGTSRRTLLEYLNELESRNEIVIDGNNIWTPKQWAKILKSRERDYLNGEVEKLEKQQKELNA